MVNLNYRKGAEKERKIVNFHRSKGRLAFRSAGSHSPIDVFVLDLELKQIKLIQSKPKSMSENKKQEILNSILKFEGDYKVIVSVE